MDLGKPVRIIHVEPLSLPVPLEAPKVDLPYEAPEVPAVNEPSPVEVPA